MTLAWHDNHRTPKALHPTAQGRRASRRTLGSRTTTRIRTPKALHPTAQGRRALRRTLGHRRQHAAVRRRRYTPQPRVDALCGAPWVTDNNTHPYAEGVPPHSPGSTRFAAHPGSRTTTRSRTPKALHPTAQGRRASRRTLGHGRQHASVRRRRSTPQPRVDALRGAPWVTDDNTQPYAEGVTPHSPGSTRFAAHPGSRTTTRSRTPQALHPAAQGRRASRRTLGHRRQHAAVRRRRYTPQPRVDALRGAPWVTDDNTHGYPEGVLQRAAITMTPPSRLVKRLRRIVRNRTGNPGCAAKRGDPGLWEITASR